MLQYGDDYDDRMPPWSVVDGVAPNYTFHDWWGSNYEPTQTNSPTGGFLYPYTHSTQIKECPSFSIQAYVLYASYGFNVEYMYNTPPAPDYLHKVQIPGETVLLTDTAYPTSPLQRAMYAEPPSKGEAPTIHGRHQGLANVLWFDGHVKASRVTPRATTYASPAYLDAVHIGDLLRGGVRTGDPVKDDYYFEMDKQGQ